MCIHVCVHACMSVRRLSCIYMRVHACIHVCECINACMLILQYPQSSEIDLAGFATTPPPHNTENLPTPMRCHLKISLIQSSSSPCVWRSKTIFVNLVEGIIRNIFVELFSAWIPGPRGSMSLNILIFLSPTLVAILFVLAIFVEGIMRNISVKLI